MVCVSMVVVVVGGEFELYGVVVDCFFGEWMFVV